MLTKDHSYKPYSIRGIVLFTSLCIPASAQYTYVGNFAVADGPLWTTNPPTYTGQEAAALLFADSGA
jgi:hypothetical protein